MNETMDAKEKQKPNFDPPENLGDEEITIMDFESKDQSFFGRTMRSFSAKIKASKDQNGDTRIVHFMFDGDGKGIIAKDIRGHVSFEFVENDVIILSVAKGKKYPVFTHRYKNAKEDNYALLPID